MRYDASKDLKINYQINHALWLLGESNEEESQFENCDEEAQRIANLSLEDRYMKECSNFCKHSQEQCSYCKEHYDVSTEEYKAKRCVNDNYVTGYLVKDKQGNIQGILNKATHYHELAWIDEDTLVRLF